jgi:hypothetical protein
MNDISMTRDDYRALDDARDHTLRALSAARASSPMDSVAMAALDTVRDQLSTSLRVLDALKQRARVSQ